MIFITDDDVRRHVPFEAVLHGIERAFVALHAGASTVFEVVRGSGGGDDHFFAIKSARDGSIPVLGLKAGSYAPGNQAHGLPAHSSTTLLFDDVTGLPTALVQANYLNSLRTSAANALAVRALASPDATTLSLIGIGAQGVFEALGVQHVRPIRRILAVGRSEESRRRFIDALRVHSEVEVEFTDAESAARCADILVTATPSKVPLVHAEWIRPGTHISAMGADDVGKQELDVELTARASLWVDHPAQAVHIGETQHAFRSGRITLEQLHGRTLGHLLAQPDYYRRQPEDITLFDSSGIAIQDLAAAHVAWRCVTAARARSEI